MKTSNGKQLAKKMLIAMICGLACGFGCIMLREHLVSSGQTDLWTKINNLFFQDITQPTATKAVGIFYIVGQLFVNSLQLIIVPMVFVSITLAISTITDTKKLGRISTKTILTFFITTVCALCFAGVVASIVYRLGFFNAVGKAAVTIQQGSTGSNPLNIILNIIPNNLISAFSTIGNVLAIVFIAFAIYYAAYFAEIYRGGIESMPVGQYEAAKILGYNKVQTFFRIILPQVIKSLLPSISNEVITLVKDTSLAFVVAGAEMFTIAKQIASAQTTMMPFVIAAVFYYVFNLLVAIVMQKVEKSMNYYR